MGRSSPDLGSHRVKVPHRLSLAGPAGRARLVPDCSQTADQVGRGRDLGTDPRRSSGGGRRWAVDGTWERILAAVLGAADADADIGWTVSVDSTVCRAHQHAAGARKKGLQTGQNPTTMPSDAPAAA
nr:hypothetical protein [Streptomyces sp. EAG2]